jgi:hypothetical protein
MQLSRVWFLLEPFDVEYKKYLILGALNEINADWTVGKILGSIHEISEYIKDLNLFVSDSKISNSSLSLLSDEESEIYTKYRRMSKNGSNWDQIFEIIIECHNIFSEKIKEGIDLRKKISERVKIFSITPELAGHKKGILIMRNIETHDLDFYSWGCAKINNDKMGVIMKKIHTDIMSYSLSYEYIVSELINSLGMNNNKLYVVIAEILESDVVTDDLLKMTKEKFTDFIIEDLGIQNKG